MIHLSLAFLIQHIFSTPNFQSFTDLMEVSSLTSSQMLIKLAGRTGHNAISVLSPRSHGSTNQYRLSRNQSLIY